MVGEEKTMKGLEAQALASALAQLREGSFGKRAGVGQGPLQNGGREPVPRARNKLQAVRASRESLYPVEETHRRRAGLRQVQEGQAEKQNVD